MFNQERHEKILQDLRERGTLSVEELSKSLNVSSSTIRRDLEELEKRGRLKRMHGGATITKGEGAPGMKIFLDSANIEEIKKAAAWNIIDGITTNPSSLAKEGKTPQTLIDQIGSVISGPIFLETLATERDNIVSEAEGLVKLGENIAVKIPVTREGIQAMTILTEKNIKTAATLVFSFTQALLAARAGASYSFPFIGRLEEAGEDAIGIVRNIIQSYRIYDFGTEVVGASIKTLFHLEQIALAGAAGVTIPFTLLEKLVKHPLTAEGVQKFLADGKKSRSS
jgi:transaldolase